MDVALVLAVDVSGSIDAEEFKLQKEGIALALLDPAVQRAIRNGPHGRIAVAYVEWASPGGAAPVLEWRIVRDEASARDVGAALLAASRTAQSYNAIGDAIVLGTAMIRACPCRAGRTIIDVSGDNRDMRSVVPATLAREAAAREGITVNALAILQDAGVGPSGKPLLVEAYEREVIGGAGAFVAVAQTRADFGRAIRRKMAMEISDVPVPVQAGAAP
ncbi:MAG: DUF1194 domain-containing protein [Alphaproteobacteria bacterium]|nr:DUF1194 domain-containing protein [Alphaproteobacteria bacterium]